jgi:Transposase
VLAYDSRKNALLKAGNKNDRIDARKLSELLYLNKLNPVYHGEPGIRTLKELARSYISITRDLTRVMNRLKAIYRSGGSLAPASMCLHRATMRNYAPWVRAQQVQLEADVRRTGKTHEPQREVHGGDARVIPLKSGRRNGGGGGSRTPVREALQREDYMLSPFRFFRRKRSERARRACN